MMDFREKAKQIHESVNHTYSGYNYILHLDAVIAVAREFRNEFNVEFTIDNVHLPNIIYYNTSPSVNYQSEIQLRTIYAEKPSMLIDVIITSSVYFHDVIEDCRMTYNDVKNLIGETAADIVYAVTNHKGKTRKDRANELYYQEIRETPGASFVKMCDRIANVRFSRLMGSSMYEKYKQENEHFMESVNADDYPKMKECLINLFK